MLSMSTDHHRPIVKTVTIAARSIAITPLLLLMMMPSVRCTANSPLSNGYEAVDAVIPNYYYRDSWFSLRSFLPSSFVASFGPPPHQPISTFNSNNVILSTSASHTEDNKKRQPPSSQLQSQLEPSEVRFFGFIAELFGFAANAMGIVTFIQDLFTSPNDGGGQTVNFTPILDSMNSQFNSVQQELNSIIAAQQLGEIEKYNDVEVAVVGALNDMKLYNRSQSVELLQRRESNLFDELDYFLRGMLGQNSLSADILDITAVLSHCNSTTIENLVNSYITIVNYGMVGIAYYSQMINNTATNTTYSGPGKLTAFDAKRTLVRQRHQAVQATCGHFAKLQLNNQHDKEIHSIRSAISSTLNQFDEIHNQQKKDEKGFWSVFENVFGFVADATGIFSFVQDIFSPSRPPVTPVDLAPILDSMNSQFNSVHQQLNSIIDTQQRGEIQKYSDVEMAVVGAFNDMQPYNRNQSVELLKSRASNLFDTLDYFLRGMLGQNSLSVDILKTTTSLLKCNSAIIVQQINSYITIVNFGMGGLAYYSQMINNPATIISFDGEGKVAALDAKRTLINQRLQVVQDICDLKDSYMEKHVTSVLRSDVNDPISPNSIRLNALKNQLLKVYQQVSNLQWFILIAEQNKYEKVALVGFRKFSISLTNSNRVAVVAPFKVTDPLPPLQLNINALNNYIKPWQATVELPEASVVLSALKSQLSKYFIGRQPTCMLLYSVDRYSYTDNYKHWDHHGNSTNFAALPYLSYSLLIKSKYLSRNFQFYAI